MLITSLVSGLNCTALGDCQKVFLESLNSLADSLSQVCFSPSCSGKDYGAEAVRLLRLN